MMIYNVTPEVLVDDSSNMAANFDAPLYIMFAGAPCSGKSTIISNLYFNAHVYSTDAIIEEMAVMSGRSYSEVFKQEKFKTFKQQADMRLEHAMDLGMDVIHDQTNMSVASRAKNLANMERNKKFNDYHKILVFMDTPENVIMDRLKERNKGPKYIPEPIVMNFLNNKELPTYQERFEHIFIVR